MTGEILHMANVSTNLMADPSQQITMGSSRQTEDAQTLKTICKVWQKPNYEVT